MKKVLIVLTNQGTYGKDPSATGLWLGEATEFVRVMEKNKIQVDYVSPKGGSVPLDPRSMGKRYTTAEDLDIYHSEDFQHRALTHSLSPKDISSDNYFAVYYTGGHGVMWDFPNQPGLEQISRDIYQQGGYLTSVCHGIAGLLYLKGEAGDYIISGKKITGFTSTEEWLSGKRKLVPFMNEDIAKKHGASFYKKRFFTPFALQDGQLITGQNPQSATAVANALIKNILKQPIRD